MLEKLKKFLYKNSFKKEWDIEYQGSKIHVENWWNLFLASGENYSIDGKVVQSNFRWLPEFSSIYTLHIEGIGNCKILIASKWNCNMGCHVLIEDNLIGGDIGDKLLFLPRNTYAPKKFDSKCDPYPSTVLRLLAFLTDTVLLILANVIIYCIVFELLGAKFEDQIIMFYSFWWQLAFSIFLFGILQPMEEGTFGKKIFKMSLVNKDLNKLKVRSGLKRYCMNFLFILTGGIGFVRILFTKDRTGWHDKLSDSIVVKSDYLAWERYIRLKEQVTNETA